MKHFLFISFSKALNRYFQLDPDSKQRLQILNGKVATLEWLPFHFVLQCIFKDNEVQIQPQDDLPADVKISGTPWQMFNQLMKNETNLTRAGDLTIEGDVGVAQQLLALFKDLEWDKEDYLSQLIGAIPTYHVSRTLKQMKHGWDTVKHSFESNLNEYLHEETNWFPPKESIMDFLADVDVLRMDVDRIEAKLNQLIQNHELMGKQ